MMNLENITIPYDKKTFDATLTYTGCVEQLRHAVILTHGAGGHKDLKQLVTLSEHLSGQRLLVVRFTCKGLNIKYRSRVYKHVVEYILEKYPRIDGCFLAGRSMGARAAVLVANEVSLTNSINVLGVICLSYPLHPPRDYNNRRDEPLYQLQKPVLFVSGTNDFMCDKDIFHEVFHKISNASVIWIESGDHGLSNKAGTHLQDSINRSVGYWCSSVMIKRKNQRRELTLSMSQTISCDEKDCVKTTANAAVRKVYDDVDNDDVKEIRKRHHKPSGTTSSKKKKV